MTKVKQEPDALAVQIARLDALKLIATRKNDVPSSARTNKQVEADTILLLIVNSLLYQQDQIRMLTDNVVMMQEDVASGRVAVGRDAIE